MMIEVQRMVNCLRKMQQSDSEEYTEQLEEICLDITALYQFRNIMGDDNIEEPTRKMAAIFFKNYFMERYSDFEEVFFVELVMGIVMDQKLSYKYKILIEDTIVNMIEWVQKENLVEIIDCLENAFRSLQRASGNEFLSTQKKNFRRRQNLDYTKLNLNKCCQFNLQTEEDFINLGYSVIHFVECFTSTVSIDTEDLHRVVRISLARSLTIFSMKKTESCLRLQMVILHMWLGYIEMIEGEEERLPQLELIQQEIFEEDSLWGKLMEVYEYGSFSFTGIQGQEDIFVCSPEQPQRKIINKMKNYACQSKFLQYVVVHLKLLKYESECTESIKLLKQTVSLPMLTRIIKTLSYFSMQKSMLSVCSCEEFVNSLLTLFIYMVQEFNQIIDTNWTNLLHMIIFPLLTMDENEFKSFDEEPEEFSKLAEDCCDKQHLGELKTEAARLLEILADKNFTYCEYVAQFCCLSIQNALFENNLKTQNNVSFLPLQAAFMVLSILSYKIANLPLESSTLKTILLSPECQKLSEIQASRVFLFLAYNYTEIFKSSLEGKQWITNALNGALHQTTKITALDFLLNTVDEYFEEEFLALFSVKLTEDTEIRQVWDVLNKLLNNHLNKVNEQTMVLLIERILQRMSADIIRYKEKKIKTTANVNSGLQLMRKILSNRKYVSNKPKVMEEILKVVPQYKAFKQLNLEDVILKIINEFMEFGDALSQEMKGNLFQIDLIEEFREEGYRPTPFYWIWNQFIVKEQNFDKIKDIKNILMQGLQNLYSGYLADKKKTKSNLPIAHSLLILQHILTLHGQKFTSQEIYQLYSMCVMMLPEDINEPERLNLAPAIIGRTLIVITLCYMLKNNETLQNVEQINALKYLLLYHDEEGVFTGHNAEVIVKLLCKALFRESDPVSVTEMINIMVRVLRPTHKEPSQHKGQKTQKRSTKFKIKSTQNYEAILKKLKLPLDFNTSAQNELKYTLTTMKQNNEPLYKSIINYLPTNIKDKLRDLLARNSVFMKQVGAEKSRRIMRVGGIKKGMGYHVENDAEDSSVKRPKNFHQIEEKQLYEEIDENQLMIEHSSKDQYNGLGLPDDNNQDKKQKLKQIKMKKKFKANESAINIEKQYI